MMVDPMVMIVQNSRLFLSDVTPTELTIYVIQTFGEGFKKTLNL